MTLQNKTALVTGASRGIGRGKAGGLKMDPLKAAYSYHSSVSRNCSIR